MKLEDALKKYGMCGDYIKAKEVLKELCRATCNCGYPTLPDGEHTYGCGFTKAYDRLLNG